MINLNNVKSIVHNNKQVKSISHNGNVIWQEPSNDKIYWNNDQDSYELDNKTFVANTQPGAPSSFYGCYVWTDGTNLYYSNGTTHLVWDADNSTWTTKSWVGNRRPAYGYYIWKANGTLYYGGGGNYDQYKYNPTLGTWETQSWTGTAISYPNGGSVFSNGTDYYHRSGEGGLVYQMDHATNTIYQRSSYFSGINFSGSNVWTPDGILYYASNNTTTWLLDWTNHTGTVVTDSMHFKWYSLFKINNDVYATKDNKIYKLTSYNSSELVWTEVTSEFTNIPSSMDQYTGINFWDKTTGCLTPFSRWTS